jgi:hypothetical protein
MEGAGKRTGDRLILPAISKDVIPNRAESPVRNLLFLANLD